MKSLVSRASLALVLAVIGWMALSGASTPAPKQPDKLVILSTVDVKGKTSPCG